MMRKQRKPTARSRPRPGGSLLSPESTGGITAGKGFDFQTRFAACQLPVWLLEAAFHQLLYEGTGDIDIRYQEGGTSSRIHIQVKDHEVSPAEFKESLAHFQRLDADLPGVYKCFSLVCPGLSPKLRPIETGLARFRNVRPFYDDVPTALAPTKSELDARIRKIGLNQGDVDFIHASIKFEVGHGDLQHDDRALELFIARLLNHPEYADRLRAMVQPAFADLLAALQGTRGKVLDRTAIEEILRAAVTAAAPGEKSVTIWMQNWTRETFDVPADYTIEWSRHFDRATRRVPDATIWNSELLPELNALRATIQSERTERLIRFRGKCPLSSGIALGAAFPAVGGWKFEIPQPPAPEPWRSDAPPASPYYLQVALVDGGGDDVVLGLNIRGDGREDIRRFVDSTGHPPKIFAFMSPSTTGSQSIGGAEEACAFARAVREEFGELLKAHGVRRTRLFFYGPLALAVFLGQQLTSVGEIQLFEYQDPGYIPSCTVRT
ncbi:MAG: dsDNA nuclease domain-containing protein [Vicinamibacterales bacterium]